MRETEAALTADADAEIFGFVDHAHAAATQFLDNSVVRDGLADHWSRILRR